MMNNYLTLKDTHRKEFEAFPMAFAFSDKQFEEGMKSLGLTPDDTDKIYKMGGTGGFYRRTDAKTLHGMLIRHDREMKEAIASDVTGEGFIFEMFNYELGNHEYSYTGNVSDTLAALGLTMEEVGANPALTTGLEKAKQAQYESCTW